MLNFSARSILPTHPSPPNPKAWSFPTFRNLLEYSEFSYSFESHIFRSDQAITGRKLSTDSGDAETESRLGYRYRPGHFRIRPGYPMRSAVKS